VFGAGPVGLLCCAVAKAMGASSVVSVDLNEERVEFAKMYAATHTFKPGKDEEPDRSAKRLVEECGLEMGADAVIDATGAGVCLQTGIHALRGGGTYCQVGLVSLSFLIWP